MLDEVDKDSVDTCGTWLHEGKEEKHKALTDMALCSLIMSMTSTMITGTIAFMTSATIETGLGSAYSRGHYLGHVFHQHQQWKIWPPCDQSLSLNEHKGGRLSLASVISILGKTMEA